MKIFYFIRHGQTDLNAKGIVQGRGVNSPLNNTGFAQAKAFYEHYKDIPFDKIYTSTLLRTEQTVQQFIEDGIPRESLSGLDEISWGIYEGQEQDPSIMAGFEKVVNSWREGQLDVAIQNGESPNQLLLRQQEAVDYMLDQQDENVVLVCMHGRALRILLTLLVNIDPSRMDEFPHTNTALYKLKYENGVFEIVDHYNTVHLNRLSSNE